MKHVLIPRDEFIHLYDPNINNDCEQNLIKQVKSTISEIIEEQAIEPATSFFSEDIFKSLGFKTETEDIKHPNGNVIGVITTIKIDDPTMYERGSYPYKCATKLNTIRDNIVTVIFDMMKFRHSIGEKQLELIPKKATARFRGYMYGFDKWLTQELRDNGYEVINGDLHNGESYIIKW